MKNESIMKTIIRSSILLLGLCLFSCAPKERPVPLGDGTEPVYISNPQMVTDDGHTYIFYIRNNEPVKAEMLEDGLLSAPVYVDENKWLSFLESEVTFLPEVDEETQAAVDNMPFASELVPTPDNERFFFTAYNRETGKRELYWVRNEGVLPVRLSQDGWWDDFSVPFGFIELKDQEFADGSKSYMALCLVNNHWNPGEICAVYMDGRTQYTILSHENTILRDSLSKTVMVGKNQMTTSKGSIIHYLDYSKLGSQRGENTVDAVKYINDNTSSCVAWNEKAIKNALAGERVIVVSNIDFLSESDNDDFQYYILANDK